MAVGTMVCSDLQRHRWPWTLVHLLPTQPYPHRRLLSHVYFEAYRLHRWCVVNHWTDLIVSLYYSSFVNAHSSMISLVSLQSGGYTHPWVSGYVLGTMLSGLALIVGWVVYEWKFARHPMVPGELFKGQRIVGLAYVIAFAAGMNFFSVSPYDTSPANPTLIIPGPQLLPCHIYSCLRPRPSEDWRPWYRSRFHNSHWCNWLQCRTLRFPEPHPRGPASCRTDHDWFRRLPCSHDTRERKTHRRTRFPGHLWGRRRARPRCYCRYASLPRRAHYHRSSHVALHPHCWRLNRLLHLLQYLRHKA
jgi:hypothetical protein